MSVDAENIFKGLEAKLRSFILSKVHDPETAGDILQETFLRIHSKADTIRDDAKIHTWIYQVVRNLIADHFRKSRTTALADEHGEINPNEDPDDDFMEEAISDMISMMENMPAEYCEALCLTELEGLSQKEYSVRAGISYSGAKSRVQRGRAMLKDMLMRCCHYEFDKFGTVLDITPYTCCCCHPETP